MSREVSVVAFPEHDIIAKGIAREIDAVHSSIEIHRFPDDESCVRVDPEKIREQIIVVCTLFHPDPITIPLLFLSDTLRDFGAKKRILVAPYLAYMRQDRRFHDGEGISARYFSRLLSNYFDALITVDPHLHRIHSLDEVYSIPARVVHAAPLVTDWIRNNIEKPLLIGPDSESEQWVRDLAQRAEVPFVVLEKTRRGDREVDIRVPQVDQWSGHTPVLFDDIISTGKTMVETIRHLKHAGLSAPVCIGVHGIFAGNAYEDLLAAGAERVITTNSIQHSSNAIDLTSSISKAAMAVLELPA